MSAPHRNALILLLAGALGGCAAFGMNERPEPLVGGAPAYHAQGANAALNADIWYHNFNDPVLNGLIEQALSENLTLRQALARFEAARARTDSSRAARLPAIGVSGDAGKIWEEGDAQDTTARFGATLEWEADIFGRLAAAEKADRLQAVAAASDLEAVRLSLAADIAAAYYNAVAAHRTLALLEAQGKTDGEALSLIELRNREGIGTQVEVLQQQTQLAASQSLIPVAQATLRAHENHLDVLTGTMPDGRDATTRTSSFPAELLSPPTGIPSDLLLNRPDLRAARARLVAADANIAAAIAERLPRVTLSGSYLLATGGNPASPVLSLLGGLVQPLLDWGRREAEVRRNKALYDEQLAAFSQLYLEAVEDVETTLYQIDRQKEYLARLRQRETLIKRTLAQTRAVFDNGMSDYLPVLSALQDLRAVERTVLEEERDLALLHVQLYRALGGAMP